MELHFASCFAGMQLFCVAVAFLLRSLLQIKKKYVGSSCVG